MRANAALRSSNANYKWHLLLGHETACGRCKQHVGFSNHLDLFHRGKKYISITSFYELHLWCLLLNDQCDIKHQSLLQKGAQTSHVTWLIYSQCGCRREWRKCLFLALLEATDYSKHIFSVCSVPLGSGPSVFPEKSLLCVFITSLLTETPQICANKWLFKRLILSKNKPLIFQIGINFFSTLKNAFISRSRDSVKGEEKNYVGVFSSAFPTFNMFENAPVNKATYLKCFNSC